MRQLKNLKITKSIDSKKLIFDESWEDKFETLFTCFIFSVTIYTAISCLRVVKPSANSDLEYLILICTLIFSIYYLYCKFTEKCLKEIKFTIHKEEAKQRILEYGKKYNYRISKISNNLIFLNEPIDDLSPGNSEKTTIIFFKDNSIFYTLIMEGFKLNRPVLISQHITRMDLKKLLNLKKTKIQVKKNTFSSLFFND